MSGNIKQAAAAARRASQLLATTPEAVRDEALAAKLAERLRALRLRLDVTDADAMLAGEIA